MNLACRKLTNSQVFEIRTLFRDGVLQKVIAAMFGVNQTNISSVVTGRHYQEAPWPPPISSSQVRKSLPKFPGYEFDAEGNAYSFHFNKRYGRLMNLRLCLKGYFMVSVHDANGKPFFLRVNRVICTLFHGPPPTPKHQARHLNGIKTDNRAMNLAWGTQKENDADKVKHGTNTIGERSGNSKLTEDIIRKIRVSKLSTRELAKEYNVSQPLIVYIKQRKRWSHVL